MPVFGFSVFFFFFLAFDPFLWLLSFLYKLLYNAKIVWNCDLKDINPILLTISVTIEETDYKTRKEADRFRGFQLRPRCIIKNIPGMNNILYGVIRHYSVFQMTLYKE